MSATDVRSILDAAANQILAVVAPLTARLVRAYVTLDETADTAATDGIRIWVPPIFEGVDVTQDTPVAIGLLVHELGHFLQPLKALEEVEQRTGAPHWLGNIIADIELEAMMAGLFPPLAATLKAVRSVVKQARQADYRKSLREGQGFPAMRLFRGAGRPLRQPGAALRHQLARGQPGALRRPARHPQPNRDRPGGAVRLAAGRRGGHPARRGARLR